MRQSGRIAILLTGTIACAAFFFAFNKTAQADPHATFFTAIGQQQLFFNMLAALDQADYVEPAQNTTGTPSGQSRQELLDKRKAAGFSPIEAPALDATKTDLASILTRSVTLEGHDLWTAYIAFQVALEVSRRNNTDEVLKIYCQEGLGLTNCEKIANEPEDIQRRKQAQIIDPVEQGFQPAINGFFAALMSGLPGDQEYREKALADDASNGAPTLPIAYDPGIAVWWKNAMRNSDAQELAGQKMLSFSASYFPNMVHADIWDYISFDSQGNAQLAMPTSRTGTNTAIASSHANNHTPLSFHKTGMGKLLHNYRAIPEVARAGQARIAGQIIDTEVDGALPTLSLKNRPGVVDGEIGEVGSVIEVAARTKVAAEDAAFQGLLNTEQNLQYTHADGATTPGDDKLTNRSSGSVQGINSSNDNSDINNAGQVAGQHHEPRPDINKGTLNPTGFKHEQHANRLLGEALGHNPAGGCGCSLGIAVNGYGQNVLRRINSL